MTTALGVEGLDAERPPLKNELVSTFAPPRALPPEFAPHGTAVHALMAKLDPGPRLDRTPEFQPAYRPEIDIPANRPRRR
jgi:hypothetical protein